MQPELLAIKTVRGDGYTAWRRQTDFTSLTIGERSSHKKGNAMGLKKTIELQWKKRIILVQASEQGKQVVAQLQKEAAAINERDIIWFVLTEAACMTNWDAGVEDVFVHETQTAYFSADATQRVILIGKDGTVKQRTAELNLTELFALIDGMPMRRAEMQR
jgi:hypothetical protein